MSIEKIKSYCHIIVALAILCEMVFFPSFHNLLGCCMTAACWAIFAQFGLNVEHIRKHIFAWLMFLSMSMYRILPLFATLMEFKPISFHFQMPIETFIGETLLYLLSVGAFLLATKRKTYNTRFHSWLNKIDLYDTLPVSTIWFLGFIGVTSQLYILISHVEIGNIFGKFFSTFVIFTQAPIILFFPTLYKKNSKVIFNNNPYLWIYLVMLVLMSFASNSRQGAIEPFGTFALLLGLVYLKDARGASKVFARYKVGLVIAGLILIPLLSDISVAILASRGIRSESGVWTMIVHTAKTCLDRQKMEELYRMKEASKGSGSERYSENWTEEYVDNFALNRYCNIRITDATLYYAEGIGWANPKMRENFDNSIIKLLPMPVLSALGVNVDKTRVMSPGDYLYYQYTQNRSYLGSMRVTSHLADGLATFGLLYFPIQFLLFWLCFLALDSFCVNTTRFGVRYSYLALFTIFSFLGLFRNANGCFGDLSYLFRSFPTSILIYWIGVKIASILIGKIPVFR